MPAPSPLSIATSSLNRLVKEESSYHKELEQQQARIAKLEGGEGQDDENAEYTLKQEVSFNDKDHESVIQATTGHLWLT